MIVLGKKKTALILLLVIATLSLVIIVAYVAMTPPRPPLPSQPNASQMLNQNEAEKTTVSTIDNSSQTAATVPTTIDVASTTSAFPFVQRWAAQYENQQLASLDKINIVYLDEGQLDGANSERY